MKPSSRRLVALALAVLVPAARPAGAQGLHGVWTRDGIDVIAVGDNGDSYRSLDGGLNWTERVIGSPTLTLRAVTGRGLAILTVGDGGWIGASADAGGHWTTTLAPGSPDLRAAAVASDSVWVVAGSDGTILRSTDAGTSWSGVASGTSHTLNALRFTDGQHGWAVGDGGTLLATVNGGASWSPRALGTSNALLSVDQSAAAVWVVGAEGTAWRSSNGGASFDPLNLGLDARADVRCVAMQSPDTVWLAGGGGFVRRTTDAGATWTFAQHPLHVPISCLATFGQGLWVGSATHRVVMSSLDGGVQWRLPVGATFTLGWGSSPRYPFSGQVRGSGFALNPVYKSTIYCGIGPNVVRSRDDGDTWQVAAALPANYTKCNVFLVSPKDSNLWLAAASGPTVSDRVFRSTDGGANWSPVITHDYGEYGIPLALDPDRPDTVWFGGEINVNGSPEAPLYRSVDFGATWDSIATALFRSPCVIVAVPDTTGIVLVGDGVTGAGNGQYLKSTDGGLTFAVQATQTSSEIPGMATSRLRRGAILGTNWSSGGVQRSTDYGDTWPTAANTLQAWGIDIAKDDPNVVMFGQYSLPYESYLSLDGGGSYAAIKTPVGFANNYGVFVRDRATFLVEQSSGIWKLQASYDYTPLVIGQSLLLASPAGGESWDGGSVHDITWVSSAIVVARIEYQRAPGEPWQRVADVGGYLNHYAWQVPWDVATDARLRISDSWDGDPADSMSAGITITTPRFDVAPDTVRLPAVQVGYGARDPLFIGNSGNAPLVVSAISVANPVFWVGRSSLVVPPGAVDTVGVYYRPTAQASDVSTLTIASNAFGSPHVVVATGQGIVSLDAGPETPGAFALAQNRPNPFTNATRIVYTLPRAADVRVEVFDLHGHRVAVLASGRQSAGPHEVRFGVGAPDASGALLGRLPAGVYFYRVRAGAASATRKMLLLE
jgi:photosystem II stability/assembly factor-like uncharacterized protein